LEGAHQAATRALEAARQVACPYREALALSLLGRIDLQREHLDMAQAHFAHALLTFAQAPARPPHEEASAEKGLGEVFFRRGEVAQARQHFERGMALFERDSQGDGLELVGALAQLHLEAGRTAVARELLSTWEAVTAQSVTLHRVRFLCRRGVLAARLGSASMARDAFEQASALVSQFVLPETAPVLQELHRLSAVLTPP